MKGLPLVSLALALAVTPPSSDITIKTRQTSTPANGAVETITVQLKGSRQRFIRQTTLRDGHVASSYGWIVQCDTERMISINDIARIYAIDPVQRRPSYAGRGAVLSRTRVEDTRRVVEVQTIDAVDTGERRTYGPFAARHVVTTITIERDGGAPIPTNVRDGWYIDMPGPNCEQPGEVTTTQTLVGGHDRVEVRTRGRAKTGFPVEERDRHTFESTHFERTTTLVEFSEAPIPDSVFEIPDGYQPALPLPFGGHDLSRSDTLWNRASAYWSSATQWVQQWWR
jgi:hypothetical protein